MAGLTPPGSRPRRRLLQQALAATAAPWLAPAARAAAAPAGQPQAPAVTANAPPAPVRQEVRATWLTTTANTALASPAATGATMRALREIGLNTVYVESWKNGYTQFPSRVLERTIGVATRPGQALQDPSDNPGTRPARDLLEEALIEAHRQGLVCVAWFEYGFMAAHGSTHNHLRRLKPEWLSRDRRGQEVAPNGFVWMNPLRPEVRAFLLELTLEAIGRYDLDGVQFDDRIVWPHVTMGYDDYTRAAYAAEHGGRAPPDDPHDAAWMRWRAGKLDALARPFAAALRAALPGRAVSLSPAVYPWSYENYLLDWPSWGRWPAAERWTEVVPQAYRFSLEAFERTWAEQVQALQQAGSYRARELLAGIRIVGDGRDSSWEQLRGSIELTRRLGNGGHALWFSRGVLDLYARELAAYYSESGPARSPFFPAGWRQPSLALHTPTDQGAQRLWRLPQRQPLRYRLIGHDGQRWHYLEQTVPAGAETLALEPRWQAAELLVDRRGERPGA
jgi:uncharacterized lipoprotein YddW (UPF0748 family)